MGRKKIRGIEAVIVILLVPLAFSMDFNSDSSIDSADLQIMVDNWGSAAYDVNSDGIMDIRDIVVVRQSFTDCIDADSDGACTDCNDNDPDVYPGNTEVCDGKDNDCNGAVDDSLTAPSCSLQVGVCQGSVKSCSGSWDECTSDEYGSNYVMVEISNNPDTSGCGIVGEGASQGCWCQAGGWQFGCCTSDGSYCNPDCSASCQKIDGSYDFCDGLDNDCDGETDEGCPCGNGVCDNGEDYSTCPSDCTTTCPEQGIDCEDHYTIQSECNGVSTAVDCHKYGICTAVGDGTACSWGPGSYCEDPCACTVSSDCPSGQACVSGSCEIQSLPENKFGIGLVDHGYSDELDYAKELSGDGGYILLIFPGVSKGMAGPTQDWKNAVQGAYDRNLIPVIRIQPSWGDMEIRSESNDAQHLDYTTLAMAYKNVIAGLPRKGNTPLYVQVHNEPNLCAEWICSGGGSISGGQMAKEYAHFYEDVYDALKAHDSSIQIAPAGLAPGGAASCECCGSDQCTVTPGHTGLDYLNAMEAEIPGIFDKMDWLSSHSYPAQGVGWGFFVSYDQGQTGLRYYDNELATIGKDLPVIITETGWPTSWAPHPQWSQEQKAQFTQQAYENIWLPDSRVRGVTPFMLRDYYWGDQLGFSYVHSDGTRLPVFNTVKTLRCSKGYGPC